MKTKPFILLASLLAFALTNAKAQEAQPPVPPAPPAATPPLPPPGTPPLPAFPAPPQGDRGPRPGGERGDQPRGGEGLRGPRDGDRPPGGFGHHDGRPGGPSGERDGGRPGGPGGPRSEREDGARRGPRGDRDDDGLRGPRGDHDGRPHGEGRAEGRGPGDRLMPNPHGERRMETRPFLGVLTTPVPPALAAQLGLPEGFGLVVQDVMPDGPGAAAGVQKYDVLKMLNDQNLVEPSQLVTLLKAIGKDQTVTLTVLRKGQEQKLTATVQAKEFPVMDGGREGGPGGGRGPGALAERLRDLKVGEVEERLRGVLDHNKNIQEHMEEVKRRMRERREQDYRPGGPARPGGARIDQLLPAPGAPPLRVESSVGVTTLDSGKARIQIKDSDLEVEISVVDGKRQVTSKTAEGAVLFQGPYNTPEEQAAVPQSIRHIIDQVQVQVQDSKEKGTAAASVSSGASSATTEVQ